MALVQKAFSDIITFSRSSNATRVGPTGLVEYAPHNLLQRSQEFDNAYWTKGEASATANTIAAPDGTVTADSIIENTNPAQHEARVGFTFTGSTVYTLSVYAKTNGRNLLVYLDGFAGGRNFDLSDGTVGSVVGTAPSAATITSVGNGWYRCTITFTWGVGATANVRFLLLNGTNNSYTGNGTSGIYLWGAQLSVGPYALDYTPTTSAAVYGPRFDYDGSGVTIVDPVSRNLLLQSEDFSTTWTNTRTTETVNATAAPDGTITADKLVEDTSASNDHVINQTATVSTSTAYTYSVFIKASERTWAFLNMVDVGISSYRSWFNLSTGVVGTSDSGNTASIQSVGNGWYRCIVSRATTGSQTSMRCEIGLSTGDNVINYTGNGTSGIFIWGAQLEVGSTATGYMVSGATNGFRAVPTVSGSATARGLLVEESRTNLVTYSEQFDNAAWVKYGSTTVTANSVASPDGTISADLLTSAGTSGTPNVIRQFVTVTSGVPYTMSVYAKRASTNFIFLQSLMTGSGSRSFFNLLTGTVASQGAGHTASIQNVGNGWYRCIVTYTTSTTGEIFDMWANDNAGNAGSCYIWGAQLE